MIIQFVLYSLSHVVYINHIYFVSRTYMWYILITFTMSLVHTSGVASAQVVSPAHYKSGLLPKPFELFV